jgi:hypothetical protein
MRSFTAIRWRNFIASAWQGGHADPAWQFYEFSGESCFKFSLLLENLSEDQKHRTQRGLISSSVTYILKTVSNPILKADLSLPLLLSLFN